MLNRTYPLACSRLASNFYPKPVVLVHMLIKLLKSGEVGARRGTNNEHRLVLDDVIPCFLAVGSQVEIEAILDIHRLAKLQDM